MNRLRRILVSGLILLFILAVIIAAYANDRKNCVCYAAIHHPGERLPFDSAVVRAIEGMEPNDETMSLRSATCRHGMKLRLWIDGTSAYTVWPVE